MTLILKIFLPTFWIVFFGALGVALFVANLSDAPVVASLPFKTVYLIGYTIFLVFLLLTVVRLKRVDMDEQYFYASNYFKTYRYTYDSLERITENAYGFFSVVTLVLREKGKLGKRMIFIPSKKRFESFVRQHPQSFAHLYLDEN